MSQNDIMESMLSKLIERRAEQIAQEISKTPDYSMKQKKIDVLYEKVKQMVNGNEIEELISLVRGQDLSIYERCYQTGVVDGLWVAKRIERITDK